MISSEVGALSSEFAPARWLRGPHFQTLAGKYLRPAPSLATRRERIETPDGDFLDLDFIDPDFVGSGSPDTADASSPPRVLLLHGLEGSSRRAYMLNMYSSLAARGIQAVGLNFRGCSGEPNRTPRAYHSGDTDDIRHVVELLRSRSSGQLGLIGFSLGGNALLKYLAEEAAKGPVGIFAAAAISVPFDLAAGSDRLESGLMGRVYTSYFLKNLRNKVRAKRALLEPNYDVEAILRARTLREFDELMTAPIHGFDGAQDYYERSRSKDFISGIRTPTLVVHAMDDPFLPANRVPVDALGANPAIVPILSRRGGHVGFVSGTARRPEFWSETVVSTWMQSQASGLG